MTIGIADERARAETNLRQIDIHWTWRDQLIRWSRASGSSGSSRSATSVVCQCAMSFARRSAGAGRPSRGARYSSSSMPGPCAAPQRRDPQPRAEHVVQVLLLDVVVLALAGDLQPERVAIEAQASVGVVDDDRGVVDAEKQRGRRACHFGCPLSGGKRR